MMFCSTKKVCQDSKLMYQVVGEISSFCHFFLRQTSSKRGGQMANNLNPMSGGGNVELMCKTSKYSSLDKAPAQKARCCGVIIKYIMSNS